jgi:GNAT superfamily N-acetyltransferase
MDVNIRKASIKDVPRIIELWKSLNLLHRKKFGYDTPLFRHKKESLCLSLYKKFVTKRIQARNATVFVAELNEKTIGHIIVFIDKLPPIYVHDKQGYIGEIFVDEKYRRKGVGRELLIAGEKWAKKKGLFSLGLTVFVTNETALSAYRKFGFFEHHLKMSKIIK